MFDILTPKKSHSQKYFVPSSEILEIKLGEMSELKLNQTELIKICFCLVCIINNEIANMGYLQKREMRSVPGLEAKSPHGLE